MSEQDAGFILCVDDDDADRHALAQVLRGAGFAVKEAATAEQALALAVQQPGLVLLAINSPALRNFDVCRRIKAHPAATAIPVLCLFRPDVPPVEMGRAQDEGVAGCLSKPVDPQELIDRTRALLRTRTAERPGGHGEDASVSGEVCRSGLTKADAERLLDWLEANGCRQREVNYEEGKGFIVRWRPPLAKVPGRP